MNSYQPPQFKVLNVPSRDFISSLSPIQRKQFEAEIISGLQSNKQLALKWGVAISTILHWKSRLRDRIKAAREAQRFEDQKTARNLLEWMFIEVKEGVQLAKSQKDPRSIAQMIKAGTDLAHTLADINGELKSTEKSQTTQTTLIDKSLKVMIMPKIWDKPPTFTDTLPINETKQILPPSEEKAKDNIIDNEE